MHVIGRDDLALQPDLQGNDGRVLRAAELDDAIGSWTLPRTVAGVLQLLGEADVPAGKVYTAQDIAQDRHYRERDMILRQITRDGHELDVPGVVPKLSATPGTVRSAAPRLGEDTTSLLQHLGLSLDAIAALRAAKVVA
jgi:formyl-CoA transferase